MSSIVLSIAIAAAQAVIRFHTPEGEHGTYYLCSIPPGGYMATIEASGHVWHQEQVAATLPNDGHKLFWVVWHQDGW